MCSLALEFCFVVKKSATIYPFLLTVFTSEKGAGAPLLNLALCGVNV